MSIYNFIIDSLLIDIFSDADDCCIREGYKPILYKYHIVQYCVFYLFRTYTLIPNLNEVSIGGTCPLNLICRNNSVQPVSGVAAE